MSLWERDMICRKTISMVQRADCVERQWDKPNFTAKAAALNRLDPLVSAKFISDLYAQDCTTHFGCGWSSLILPSQHCENHRAGSDMIYYSSAMLLKLKALPRVCLCVCLCVYPFFWSVTMWLISRKGLWSLQNFSIIHIMVSSTASNIYVWKLSNKAHIAWWNIHT